MCGISAKNRCGTFAKDMDVRSKGCGASAKTPAVKMQRWGANAKVGSNRKDFSVKCGQNAKDASVQSCDAPVAVLFRKPIS